MSEARTVDPRPLIAHVVFRFSVGGLENGLVNLINRLPRERWRHAVIALDSICPEFRRRVQRDDVHYVALQKGPGHLLPQYPRVAHLLHRLAPAVVHTRNLAALEASVPAWAVRVPVRVHGEHGWDVSDPDGINRRYRRVRRLYMRFVQHYVALSRQIERYLTLDVGIPASRITQIYNGVDTDRFRPRDGARPQVAGFPFSAPDLWVVGTVGRLQPVKDQPSLARAFAVALRGNPDAARRMRLVVIGQGPMRQPMMHILGAAGLSDLAWLPGERHDVADILRCLDCFVLPSRSEGVSNTILEAMASGLPVIATRTGGNAELVEDGVSGSIVPHSDVQALRDAMLRYFAQPQLARAHAAAARRRAHAEFGLDAMAAAYEALYVRLLARAPGIAAAQRDATMMQRTATHVRD
jgi:sugar transferase (PEP-CTERM/EpsH1 system associated)